MSEDLKPEQREIPPKRALAIIFILAGAHATIAQFVGLFAGPMSQWKQMSDIGATISNEGSQQLGASAPVNALEVLDFLFSLPLLPLFYINSSTPIPIGVNALVLELVNSICVGGIIYFTLYSLVKAFPIPKSSSLYRFLYREKDLPAAAENLFSDVMRPISAVRELDELSQRKFGPPIVIAIAHYGGMYIAMLFRVGERLGGNNSGPASTVVDFFHFPVTPLFVPIQFWYSKTNGFAQHGLAIVNSLLCGVLIYFFFVLFTVVFKLEKREPQE